MNFVVQDYYFQQAKKQGYVARSAFKLQEIDEKFKLFTPKTRIVLDIGCAPGSWIQYVHRKLTTYMQKTSLFSKTTSLFPKTTTQSQDSTAKHESNVPFKIIGFDLKKCSISLPGVFTYIQDATDKNGVSKILQSHGITHVDCIISDMAPDTIGNEGVDARRSVALIRETLWLYEHFLNPTSGKFTIKVFMGPGFQELYEELRKNYGGPKCVKIFKPKACRKESKETYIVKVA